MDKLYEKHGVFASFRVSQVLHLWLQVGGTTPFFSGTAIIPLVSRFFILLLIVLLPLRGWSTEQMTTQMAVQATVQMTLGAAVDAMPADCPMRAQQVASNSDAPMGEPESQRSCQSCQLCMPLAALQTLTLQAFTAPPHTHTVASAARFVSADLVRDTKPPIA